MAVGLVLFGLGLVGDYYAYVICLWWVCLLCCLLVAVVVLLCFGLVFD